MRLTVVCSQGWVDVASEFERLRFVVCNMYGNTRMGDGSCGWNQLIAREEYATVQQGGRAVATSKGKIQTSRRNWSANLDCSHRVKCSKQKRRRAAMPVRKNSASEKGKKGK
jgi:hypothetical protein